MSQEQRLFVIRWLILILLAILAVAGVSFILMHGIGFDSFAH